MSNQERGDEVSHITLPDGTPLTEENLTRFIAEAKAGGEPASPQWHAAHPIAKIGRPPVGDSTRDKLLNMRVTAAEIEQLDAQAAAQNLTRTAYMRRQLGLKA